MNESIRRYYEMFLRVLSFMTANAADFAQIPFVAATVARLETATQQIGELGAEKLTTTATAKDATLSRRDARQNLRDALEDLTETWKSVFDEVGGAQNKYRLPRGNNDQMLIASGKSFAADAEIDKQIFIEHGFPDDFVIDLKTIIADFEEAVSTAETSRAERVGTNAAFDEQVRICRKVVEKLAPAVKRLYRNNPRKLAEWLVASHVERAPKPSNRNTPSAG